ncbi:MAG TPA: SRPBCC domain-containing protein [Verrucomicrobiae bacterium]|jgi:activator of HSP90 ATPase|nr:SRPBCC domain-containing protein [Verrucomicrobiae bacterium]
MASSFLTRRELSVRLVSMLSVMGVAGTVGAVSVSETDEISRTGECIHQEVVFKASRARIYQILTDAKQFGKVVDLIMPGAGPSTSISPDAGGTFVMFGGFILGRHIEMVPSERLVQAWREKNWEPGIYSLVNFQLTEHGPDTRLVFNQTGIPQGHADHLAPGWKSHYWEPIQKVL